MVAPSAKDEAARHAARRKFRFPLVNLLLLVPLIGTLVPSWYNRRTPELFNIPFFYWYQFVWIVLAVISVVIVYRSTRGER